MSTKSSDDKKKRSGRPQGAATTERPVIEKSLTPCPTCGCTREPVKKRLAREGIASGEHNGRPYGGYRHWLAHCAECNRAVRLTEYDYL